MQILFLLGAYILAMSTGLTIFYLIYKTWMDR